MKEKNKEKLKLYDFTKLNFAVFIFVYIFVYIILGYLFYDCRIVGKIVVGVIFAIAFSLMLYIIHRFGVNCVVITKEGVRKGKTFIKAEDACWKEEFDSRYKEKRIVFKSKTIESYVISVQSIKNYQDKVKRFYEK